MALVGLEIQTGPKALLAEDKHTMPRQSLRPHVPYEVDRNLVMVVYSLSTKGDNYSISHNKGIEISIYWNIT